MSSVAVIVRGNPFPPATSADRSAIEWREPTVSHPQQWQQWLGKCRDSARLRLWLFASRRETHLPEFWQTRRLDVSHETATTRGAVDYHDAFELQHQACVREVLRRQPDVAMIYLVSGSDVPLRSAALLLRMPTDRTLWHASPQSLPHAMRRYLGARRKLEFFGAMRQVEAYFARRHGSVASLLMAATAAAPLSSSSSSGSSPAASSSALASSSSLSLLSPPLADASTATPTGRKRKTPRRESPADADADVESETEKEDARDGDERKGGGGTKVDDENDDDDDADNGDDEIESWDDLVDVRMFEQSPWLHLTRKHAEAFVDIDFRAAFAPLDALTDDVHARIRDTFRSLQRKNASSATDENGRGGGGAPDVFNSLDPEVYLEHYKDAKERGYGADLGTIAPNDARLQRFVASQGLATSSSSAGDGSNGADAIQKKMLSSSSSSSSADGERDRGEQGDADDEDDGGGVAATGEKRPRHLQTFDEIEFGGETRADIPAYKTVTALLMVGVPASEFCDWNANDCWYVDAQQREWDAIAWRRLAQPPSCVWMAAATAAESDSDDDDDDDDGNNGGGGGGGGDAEWKEEEGEEGEEGKGDVERGEEAGAPADEARDEKGKERKPESDVSDRALSVGDAETGECVQYTFLQALAASQQDTETLFLRNVCASVRLDRLGLYTWHAIPMRVAKLWSERPPPHKLPSPSVAATAAVDDDDRRNAGDDAKSETRRRQENDEKIGDQTATLDGHDEPTVSDTCSPVRVGKQRLRDTSAAKRSPSRRSEAEKRRTWERKRDGSGGGRGDADDDNDDATPESEDGAAESAAHAVSAKKKSVTGVKRQRPLAATVTVTDNTTVPIVALAGRVLTQKSAGSAATTTATATAAIGAVARVAKNPRSSAKKTAAHEILESSAETCPMASPPPPPPPPVKKRKVATKTPGPLAAALLPPPPPPPPV